jgi:hypothetical protein
MADRTSGQHWFVLFILWPTRVDLHPLPQEKGGNLTAGIRGGFLMKEAT